MIKKIFDEMVLSAVEGYSNEVRKQEKHIELSDKYSKLTQKIQNRLSKEDMDLVMELEDLELLIMNIELEYMYRNGLRDSNKLKKLLGEKE